MGGLPKNWFDQQNMQPLKISYDELSHDPVGILGTVLSELGLDGTLANGIHPPVAKLADTINHNWAERFMAESSNL
ncbi:MAG: hypothetical protein JKX91_10385 [Rhizobiaceae bacterium]|nr:hypothetical protein [Rhizobiaceae bacterium]